MGSTDPENGFPKPEEMILSNHLTGNTGEGMHRDLTHSYRIQSVYKVNLSPRDVISPQRKSLIDNVFKQVYFLAGDTKVWFWYCLYLWLNMLPTHSCPIHAPDKRILSGWEQVYHVSFLWRSWGDVVEMLRWEGYFKNVWQKKTIHCKKKIMHRNIKVT